MFSRTTRRSLCRVLARSMGRSKPAGKERHRPASLTEAIDTTTPGGRLIFHVFGALAQFERDLIRERTRPGLSAAASRGRRSGRKPVVTVDKLSRAKALIGKGLTLREAASRLKIGKTALYDALTQKTGIPKETKA